MITMLRVGDKFTLYNDRLGLQDGSYFEALEDDNGFIMATYLGLMDETEKAALESDTIHTRIIKDGNKVLILNRYGNTPLVFEVVFDPTLYNDERALQIAFNNMVMFVGIERSNNTIQTLRYANFPMKLREELLAAWTSAFKEKNYSENFNRWMKHLYNYDLMTLWNNADDVGYFGEKGNIE